MMASAALSARSIAQSPGRRWACASTDEQNQLNAHGRLLSGLQASLGLGLASLLRCTGRYLAISCMDPQPMASKINLLQLAGLFEFQLAQCSNTDANLYGNPWIWRCLQASGCQSAAAAAGIGIAAGGHVTGSLRYLQPLAADCRQLSELPLAIDL